MSNEQAAGTQKTSDLIEIADTSMQASSDSVVSIDTTEVAAEDTLGLPRIKLSIEEQRGLQGSVTFVAAEFAGQLMKLLGLDGALTPRRSPPRPPSIIDEANAEGIKARAAMDIALAERIRTAQNIEIRESNESSGKGKAGFEMEGGSASAGIGAEGQRGSERVIKISGFRNDQVSTHVESKPSKEAPKPKAVEQAKPAKKNPGSPKRTPGDDS